MPATAQQQTEALIQLLLVARYEDKTLSLAESEAFEKLVEKLPWNSPTGLSLFLQQATHKVRKALETPEKKASYIEFLCSEFKDAAARRQAMGSVSALLMSDNQAASENKLANRLRELLQA